MLILKSVNRSALAVFNPRVMWLDRLSRKGFFPPSVKREELWVRQWYKDKNSAALHMRVWPCASAKSRNILLVFVFVRKRVQ